MKTLKEYKQFENNIFEMLNSSKNVVKMRKALKVAENAQKEHNLFVENMIAELKNGKTNFQNKWHDIAYNFEKLVDRIEDAISTRNWNSNDWQQWNLVANNID